jgi:DNA-binding winged helix-turn-helix (wHTH) protein
MMQKLSIHQTLECVTFGTAAVYPRNRELHVDGRQVRINDCAFEILLMLIEADGRLVSKKELFRHIWPSSAVVDANLRVNMHKLRTALGENAKSIQCAPNRGYRLAAPLALSTPMMEITGVRESGSATIVVIGDREKDVRAALDSLLAHSVRLPS